MSKGCTCAPSRRNWNPDGRCSACGQAVTEGQLQDAIRLALGRVSGLVLWRNNVGRAMVDYGSGEPRPLVYGLCPGSADLIGCYQGRFVAVEVKTPSGKQTPEQRLFQACVERNGGVYLLPRSVQQAVEMVAALAGGSP